MNSIPEQQPVPTQKKSKKIWSIVAVVLLLGCNPLVQTPQQNEVKSGEEIRSEEGGYAFKTIPGYKAGLGIISGEYILDSNDIDYSDPNFVVGEGPQIIFDGLISSSNLTFEKYVKNGNNDMRNRSNATISGEPQVSIAGIMGKAFDYDYELAGAGKMKARDVSVEVNPSQFFSIHCRSTTEKWDKTLAACEAVINSITFFEPKPQ